MSTNVLPYFGSKGDVWDLGIKLSIERLSGKEDGRFARR